MLILTLLTTACVVSARFAPRAVGPDWLPKDFPMKDIQHVVPLGDDAVLLYGFDNPSTTAAKVMTMGVASKSGNVWNAVGISDNGAMTGADIFVCRRNEAGNVVVEDRHATGFVLPKLDVGQDLTTLYTSQANNITACLWSRPILAPCLIEDMDIPLDKNAWIIYAHGSSNSFEYHGPDARLAKEVFLPDPSRMAGDTTATTPPLPSDAKSLDLYITTDPKGVEILQDEPTMYCYRIQELPNDARYHVVREEPLIATSAAHHLILYGCSDAQYQQAVKTIGLGETKCIKFSNVTQSRSQLNPCTLFWTGWASGGVATDLPANVGRPMGQGDHAAKYAVMEMHYDNKAGKPNFFDHSGWRLIYTRQLREHDMAVLTLGILTQQIKIPPGQTNVTLTSVCPSSCTQLLGTPVTVYSNGFHMHGIGRSAYTKVIRAGQEIPELGRVNAFDNSYQAFQGVTPRIVEPGDTLITSFTFNSQDRVNVTTGGLSTYDEMAFNFLAIYPATAMQYCVTTASNVKLAICPPSGGLDANSAGSGGAGSNSTNSTGFGQIGAWIQAAKTPTYKPLPDRVQVCPDVLMQTQTATPVASAGWKLCAGLVALFALF